MESRGTLPNRHPGPARSPASAIDSPRLWAGSVLRLGRDAAHRGSMVSITRPVDARTKSVKPRLNEEIPMTKTYRVASIPADGVGKEVIAAGRRVLDFVAAQSNGAFTFQWDDFDWGSEYYARHGRMMAEDGLETLKSYDAIYFGAVGWRNVPDHISLWGLRLNITQNFDQWANVRPVKFLPGIVSPLRKADDTQLDWVVIRENSEGEYAGLGGRNLSGRGPGNEVVLQTALFADKGCERIMRFAFDLARTRTVKKVSSVTKSNAQQYGMVLWDDVFKRVALDYPDVETESVLVDARWAKVGG